MREGTLFTGYNLPSEGIENLVFYSALIVSLICAILIKRGSKDRYYNHLAWLRGFLYFAICVMISIFSNVLSTLSDVALTFTDRPAQWHIIVDIWFITILIGYLGIWRKGTTTLNRPFFWTAIPFGLIWGISESMLMLSFWATAELTGQSVIWVALITYAIISTFTALWHSLYWDTYVSPPHNISEWNLKKILFAHNPNLFLGLLFLSLYDDVVIFLIMQTIALTSCTVIMRFPPFWKTKSDNLPLIKGGNIAMSDLSKFK